MQLDPAEIERRIQALASRVEQPPPMTQRLLAHLPEIEQALGRGTRRAELAEVFGLSTQQFAAALAGARKLARQGGDGRRIGVRQGGSRRPAATASNTTALAQTGALIKPFGGDK
jgi:hypothetical protein